MIEYYIVLAINILIVMGAFILFSVFTDGCKAIHAKITAAEKENKKNKRLKR